MSYVLSPAWHPGLLRRDLHSGDKTQECLLPPAVWIRPSCPQMPTSLFFVHSPSAPPYFPSQCTYNLVFQPNKLRPWQESSLVSVFFLAHFSSGLWSPSHPRIIGSCWTVQVVPQHMAEVQIVYLRCRLRSLTPPEKFVMTPRKNK